MMKDISPLDAELRALLDLERLRPDPPAELRAKVRAGVVAAAVGLGAVPAAAQAAGETASVVGSAAPLLAHPFHLLVVTTALGAAVVAGVALTRPNHTQSPVRTTPVATLPISAAPSIVAPPLAPAEPTLSLGARAATPPKPRARATAPAPALAVEPQASAPSDPQLAVERTLLERARAALVAGRTGQAIEAATMHQRRFPEGRLVEQRERLWIQALISSGDLTGARRRLEDLERTYPDSLFLPDLRAALRSGR